MHIKSKLTVLCLSLAAVPAGAADTADSGQTPAFNKSLASVEVKGKRSDNPFQRPAMVSHLDADVLGVDINDALRTMPGVSTQHDIGQGGFAVNIRGFEGFGRVNTTVDGVSQTFFQANPAHGYNGNTVYVDENFIAGVDVARGSVAGAAGANALAGAAEFRTIDVDDIVDKEAKFGVLGRYRQGGNGYGKNGMAAIGARHDFGDGGNIGFVSAISGKRKGGYKNGAGEVIAGDEFDVNTPMESGLRSWGTLNKIHLRPNRHHSLILSHMQNRTRFTNNHSPLQVNTQTALAKYRYNPLSDKIDLRADLSYFQAKQKFLTGENASEDYVGRTTRNPSWAFTLQNTSLFDVGGHDLLVNYGGKIMRTRYNSNYSENKLLLAEGKQDLDSLFADAEWKPGNWTVSAGLGYERYGIHGYLPPTDDDGAIVLPRGGNIDFSKREHHINPRFGLSYKPADWLELFANIGKSSRSANVQEFMYVNNVQGSPYSVNPYLKGESSFNRDIGFNIFKQGWLTAGDTLRFKAGYFNNRVKNYIVQNQFYICRDNGTQRCSLDDALNDSDFSAIGVYQNVPDTVKMRGWELEGGYDFGRAYVNVSWSRTRTNYPHDFLSGVGFSHIRTQPESVWTLDLGTRWLNDKLIVGANVKYSGADTIAGEVDTDTQIVGVEKVKANPKLFGVYAVYKPTKNLQLSLNVENLTNRVYNYPLSAGTIGVGNLGEGNNANSGTGRGRTVYGGLSLKF